MRMASMESPEDMNLTQDMSRIMLEATDAVAILCRVVGGRRGSTNETKERTNKPSDCERMCGPLQDNSHLVMGLPQDEKYKGTQSCERE